VKLSLSKARKRHVGTEDVQLYSFLTPHYTEVDGEQRIPASLPPRKNLDTYWLGERVSPRVGLDNLEKRSLVPAGIRTEDHPTRSLVCVKTIINMITSI
jgi:hypothetical protein